MNEPSTMTLSQWARRREPRLHISAKSEPEPVFLAHNLVAAIHDADASHELLRKWERIQTTAGGVGFVAMSTAPKADGQPPATAPPDTARVGADSQKVTRHAGRHILRGAIPGGILGAVVVGVIAGILAPDGGNVLGAALGGAIFGFIAGAVITFVAGSGWSEAYKESFVDPASTVVSYASIHSDDIELIRKAAKVADVPGGTMFCVDRTGRAIPLDETTSN